MISGTSVRYCPSIEDKVVKFKDHPNHHVFIEPEGRNTAPAACVAALMLEKEPDALMLIMPSDHLVRKPEAFRDAVATAVPVAESGHLVTFGIRPTAPATASEYASSSMPSFVGSGVGAGRACASAWPEMSWSWGCIVPPWGRWAAQWGVAARALSARVLLAIAAGGGCIPATVV